MEWTQFAIPLFVALEVALILLLYRYVLRDWIIAKWEEKLDEEGWLLIKLQDSFFGSVGAMTKKAQNLDPMNNIRKAAKDNDWTSLLVEYAANKAGLGGVLGNISQQKPDNQDQINPIKGIKGLK
jgi:hypothetical protein